MIKTLGTSRRTKTHVDTFVFSFHSFLLDPQKPFWKSEIKREKRVKSVTRGRGGETKVAAKTKGQNTRDSETRVAANNKSKIR